MIDLNLKLDGRIEKQIDKILLSITGADIQNELVNNNKLNYPYNDNIIIQAISDCLKAIKCAINKNIPYPVPNIDLVRSIFEIYLKMIRVKISSSSLKEYINYIVDRFVCNNDKSNSGLILQTGYINYNNPHHGKYC